MKQLLIVNDTTLNHSASSFSLKDLTTLSEGAIGFFHLGESSPLDGNTPISKRFGIVIGGGSVGPRLIPEVDFDTLKVTKAGYTAPVAKVVTVTFPTTLTKRKDYTVCIIKKGVVPNERNTWTYDFVPSADAANATAVGNSLNADGGLVNMINKNTSFHGVTASASTNTLTLTGTARKDFEVIVMDDLSGATITTTTDYVEGSGTKADIQKLAQACAADKGFNYTTDEGKPLYPGYPETVSGSKYVVYTLRFANGREFGKTTDERVTQLVHIAVPYAADGAEATLIGKIDITLGLADPVVEQAQQEGSGGTSGGGANGGTTG